MARYHCEREWNGYPCSYGRKLWATAQHGQGYPCYFILQTGVLLNDLAGIITSIQHGKTEGYTEVIDRFQDMAVGYAYASLGDMEAAKDVAQEAFIDAYNGIASLRDPAAFPGWFRRIVHTRIHRVHRVKQPTLVPLDAISAGATEAMTAEEPHAQMTRQLLQHEVTQAINTLPTAQRDVVTLFYISEYSQQEISEFLHIPVSTVKMRLYHARKRLKKEMISVMKETLYQQRPSRNTTFREDIQAMLTLIAGRSEARANDYPGVTDLQELSGVPATQGHTRLWEDAAGSLVGFAIVDPTYSQVTFEIQQADAQAHTEIGEEMLVWAAGELRKSGASAIRTNCLADNTERIALLKQQGFVAEAMENIKLQRVLTGPDAAPTAAPTATPKLPEGFTIQHVASEDDVEKVVALHRAAFGTENMTVDYRLAMMRVPEYDPTLDLVAITPDGRWAALCMVSVSEAENQQTGQQLGWLDPIGTHPDFQRQGLARALMLTGLSRLKAQGMVLAGTSSVNTNVAMLRTAESVGFREVARTLWFGKELG
ncbi:MAG: GNAT family N-acetyltransferase [Chloroflexota bacterium]